MNSFKRDRCFWIHNAPKSWFWDSFSRRVMILKVSKRRLVKQWEICCYITDKAESDISWLCLILVIESLDFFFTWLGRICLGSNKEPAVRSYFKWRASFNTKQKVLTSFSDLSDSVMVKRCLHTIFENKIWFSIYLPIIFHLIHIYQCIFISSGQFYLFTVVYQNPYPPQKIKIFISYVIPMLLELFERNKNFIKRLFKKCIRDVFFEGILEFL